MRACHRGILGTGLKKTQEKEKKENEAVRRYTYCSLCSGSPETYARGMKIDTCARARRRNAADYEGGSIARFMKSEFDEFRETHGGGESVFLTWQMEGLGDYFCAGVYSWLILWCVLSIYWFMKYTGGRGSGNMRITFRRKVLCYVNVFLVKLGLLMDGNCLIYVQKLVALI